MPLPDALEVGQVRFRARALPARLLATTPWRHAHRRSPRPSRAERRPFSSAGGAVGMETGLGARPRSGGLSGALDSTPATGVEQIRARHGGQASADPATAPGAATSFRPHATNQACSERLFRLAKFCYFVAFALTRLERSVGSRCGEAE